MKGRAWQLIQRTRRCAAPLSEAHLAASNVCVCPSLIFTMSVQTSLA